MRKRPDMKRARRFGPMDEPDARETNPALKAGLEVQPRARPRQCTTGRIVGQEVGKLWVSTFNRSTATRGFTARSTVPATGMASGSR
jgi:hypothetical protein